MSESGQSAADIEAALGQLKRAGLEIESDHAENVGKLAAGAVADFFARLDPDRETPLNSGKVDVGALLKDVRQGSDGAVWEIIEEYEPHIQRVVRRRLSQRLRSKYDTQDFVQMVWKSFFEEPKRLHGFDNSRQLFGFLAKMAQNKVDAELRRRMKTQKYDLSKEQPLEDSAMAEGPIDSPSEIAIARERWNQMIQDLPTRHQQVVRLRLEGLTFAQIAERLSIDEKTARRVLNRLVDHI